MFLRMDPGGQTLVAVRDIHRHRRLHQDRPTIHLQAHQVGCAPAQPHTCPQGLADPIDAGKARQQRGMDIHKPLREGIDQPLGHDPHPPRHHHHIHLFGAEGSH